MIPLAALLTADATVTGLVGSRIYPVVLPQKPRLPALTYTTISDIGQHGSGGPLKLSRPRIQVDCWAETYDQARVLAAAVKRALDGKRAQLGSEADGRIVQGLFFDSERDLFGAEPEPKQYRIAQDYFVWQED
ncbi:DUF3168 domain-containing protein [Rhodoligotrophos defluvii]|uniref:DUF3168 domain-containing protein n=1 Tax=Rhodoligotrophos defluvii TaxID=2561934 RepID=UPI0010C9F2DF|nr:DUF3168 domain-containing protein [Rhodoligotrophos defluvii]